MYTTQFIIFIEFIHSFVHSFVFIDLTSDVHKAARKPRCKQATLNSGNNLMLTSIEDSKIKIYIIIMALVRALGFQNWARQRFLCVQRQLHKFPYSTENENAKEGEGGIWSNKAFCSSSSEKEGEKWIAACTLFCWLPHIFIWIHWVLVVGLDLPSFFRTLHLHRHSPLHSPLHLHIFVYSFVFMVWFLI